MQSFADIRVLYTADADRTIEHLSKYYENREYLCELISSLVNEHIGDEKIKGIPGFRHYLAFRR